MYSINEEFAYQIFNLTFRYFHEERYMEVRKILKNFRNMDKDKIGLALKIAKVLYEDFKNPEMCDFFNHDPDDAPICDAGSEQSKSCIWDAGQSCIWAIEKKENYYD